MQDQDQVRSALKRKLGSLLVSRAQGLQRISVGEPAHSAQQMITQQRGTAVLAQMTTASTPKLCVDIHIVIECSCRL